MTFPISIVYNNVFLKLTIGKMQFAFIVVYKHELFDYIPFLNAFCINNSY